MNGAPTISDVFLMYLPVGLDDTETVTDSVRDDRGSEADEGLSLKDIVSDQRSFNDR